MGAGSGIKENTCSGEGWGSQGCTENRQKRQKGYWGEKKKGRWFKVSSYKKAAEMRWQCEHTKNLNKNGSNELTGIDLVTV